MMDNYDAMNLSATRPRFTWINKHSKRHKIKKMSR